MRCCWWWWWCKLVCVTTVWRMWNRKPKHQPIFTHTHTEKTDSQQTSQSVRHQAWRMRQRRPFVHRLNQTECVVFVPDLCTEYIIQYMLLWYLCEVCARLLVCLWPRLTSERWAVPKICAIKTWNTWTPRPKPERRQILQQHHAKSMYTSMPLPMLLDGYTHHLCWHFLKLYFGSWWKPYNLFFFFYLCFMLLKRLGQFDK